nr:trypsin-7-like [Aedes albopictus]
MIMFAICILLIALFNFPNYVVPGKIVGGYVDTIRNVPYTVSLQLIYEGHFCGGSLISSDWVVTAAHCVHGRSPSALTVRVGSSYRDSGGVLRDVRQIIVPEQYNPTASFDFDVALLNLMQRVSSSYETVDFIRMYEASFPTPKGMKCLTSGWGATKNPNQSSGRIKSAMLDIVDIDMCRHALYPSPVTDKMICAGGQNDDACQGDSGGPLVCAGRLAGIVSWGRGCGVVGTPGVYTFLPKVRMWIYEKTGV